MGTVQLLSECIVLFVVATQENRQADYTCQTENNVPGNQQGVFLPPCPPPFWNPENAWWGYYPLPYPNVTNDPKHPYDPYPYPPDGTAYVYYPLYNQNYAGYTQYNPLNGEKNAYTNSYPQYIIPTPPQNNQNSCNHTYGQPNSSVTIPDTDLGSNLPDNRLLGHENRISNGTSHLNPLPQWDRTNNMSRTTSSNSNKDSDCTTAMNITDEEEIPETMLTPRIDGKVHESEDLEDKPCPATSLNVNVPNYTYIDSSDSSDSTDSESHSDNESLMESSKSSSSSSSTSDNSSDSDDSDSYLAYSTGLNPHGRYEKDCERNVPRICSTNESSDDRQGSGSSSDKINTTDCDSDSEDQMEHDVERSKTDTTFPHQLSVIYEDVEHADSESPRPQETRSVRKWNDTPFEAPDDPPDEADTTTVSVSLPLRFKFSVSENNEDVTTVIVGDSTIKPERSCKDDGRSVKSSDHRSQERMNDISANFEVSSDTSVNFTVKRDASESKRKVKGHTNERVCEETLESKVEKNEETVVPHVNFTLRKNPSRLNKMNCEETVETEFTIKSKKISTRKDETKVDKDQEEGSINRNTSTQCNDSPMSKDTKKDNTSTGTLIKNPNCNTKTEGTTFEVHDFNKNVVKPEVVVSECIWGEDSTKICASELSDTTTDTIIPKDQSQQENDSDSSIKNKNDDDGTYVEDKIGKDSKHLLSVQNSREETDDEDSGVTSDMSRMISEVDTDSECTSSKNIRKYQRTQTHSRLFKLLNDDSILLEDTENTNDSPSRREYLSLPLKTNAFNYDENYCSNYSSGVTSPEYSPICEQSWRRLHDTETNIPTAPSPRVDQNGDTFHHGHPLTRQERVSCKEDPYYQAWKTSKSPGLSDHDVVPSLAFKILESRRPLWAYKVNVLCPRIKSTKSVPQALQTSKTTDSSVSPNPSSYVNLKTDHC